MDKRKIRNGNKYIKDDAGEGVFSRDPDRLYREYANLRYSIYDSWKRNFNSEAGREELMSHIDEQFIRLVREYDITSEVDFPGYIKAKLNRRVIGYLQRRIKPVSDGEVPHEFIEELRESEGHNAPMDTLAGIDLAEFIFSRIRMNDIEQRIMEIWLSSDYRTLASIGEELSRDFGISMTKTRSTIKILRLKISEVLKLYNSEDKSAILESEHTAEYWKEKFKNG